MTLTEELINRISSYLGGGLRGGPPLTDLGSWVLLHLQSIVDSGDTRAIVLAGEVIMGLVEMDEKLITLAEFRGQLQLLVKPALLSEV